VVLRSHAEREQEFGESKGLNPWHGITGPSFGIRRSALATNLNEKKENVFKFDCNARSDGNARSACRMKIIKREAFTVKHPNLRDSQRPWLPQTRKGPAAEYRGISDATLKETGNPQGPEHLGIALRG